MQFPLLDGRIRPLKEDARDCETLATLRRIRFLKTMQIAVLSGRREVPNSGMMAAPIEIPPDCAQAEVAGEAIEIVTPTDGGRGKAD